MARLPLTCTRRRPGELTRRLAALDSTELTEDEVLDLLAVLRARYAKLPVRRPTFP